jgi:hypothetical protein
MQVDLQRAQKIVDRANERVREHDSKQVVIVDIQIPLWSLIQLMVKVSIALIPTVLILALLLRGLAAWLTVLFH